VYRNKKWLYQVYVLEGKSQRGIGRICGCSHSTISKWMKKHGILARSTSNGMILYRRGQDALVDTSGSPTC
jgi:hypothetical protein